MVILLGFLNRRLRTVNHLLLVVMVIECEGFSLRANVGLLIILEGILIMISSWALILNLEGRVILTEALASVSYVVIIGLLRRVQFIRAFSFFVSELRRALIMHLVSVST